jgi:hypothetical protein
MATTNTTEPQRRQPGPDYFQAMVPCSFVQSADLTGGATKPPRLNIEAYTGAACYQWWSDCPVVTDLAGVNAESVALLLDHQYWNWDAILGQADTLDNDRRRMLVAGDVIGDGPMVEKFLRLAGRGMKFQASIGATIQRREYIDAGVKVEVNGREFIGPVLIVRECTLMEVSVLLFGADSNTSAAIAARAMMMEGSMAAGNNSSGAAGNPNAPANGAAGAGSTFQGGSQPSHQAPAADPNAQQGGGSTPSATPPVQQGATPPAPATPPSAPSHPLVQGAVGGDGADLGLPNGFDYDRLAQAIMDRGGENALLNLRKDRRPGVSSHPKGLSFGEKDVFTAGLCMHAGMSNIEKHFKPELLEAADTRRDEISLAQVILEYARRGGYDGMGNKITQNNAERVLRCAFSSHDLSDVLAATYRKFILEGYDVEDDPYEQICATGPLSDFKESKGVRVLGDFTYRKVPATGRIEHAQLSDEARPIKADLWARCTQLSLVDMQNDDAGVLGGMALMVGEGGRLAIIEEVYTKFLAGVAAGYFAAATPGSGNAFGLASLKAAGAAVLRLKDGVGKAIKAQHKLLLLPPELYDAGLEAMTGALLITGEGKTMTSTSSLKGRYTPLTSTHLPSPTTWWTVGGRPGMQPIQIGYVDGQRAPTVQSAAADFDSFGIKFRGFWGFGVALGDPLGAYTMAAA